MVVELGVGIRWSPSCLTSSCLSTVPSSFQDHSFPTELSGVGAAKWQLENLDSLEDG